MRGTPLSAPTDASKAVVCYIPQYVDLGGHFTGDDRGSALRPLATLFVWCQVFELKHYYKPARVLWSSRSRISWSISPSTESGKHMPSRLKLKSRSREASSVGSLTSVRRRQVEGLARRHVDRLVIGVRPGGDRPGLSWGDVAPSQGASEVDREATAGVSAPSACLYSRRGCPSNIQSVRKLFGDGTTTIANQLSLLVGVRGFEPPTPSSRTR